MTAAPALKAALVQVTPFQQNCTILWCETTGRAAVVDPGGDVPVILEALAEIGKEVDQILLTHGHLDHAGGAEELKAALEAKSGRAVPIVGPHVADRFLLDRIAETARGYGIPGLADCRPDRWLEEGEQVTVGTVTFDVLHCPGHSPGSVVFVEKTARFALVGDVVFAGSVGRTDLPGGDHATLIASITEKLLPLGDDIGFVCGHGPTSTFGRERRTNPFLTGDMDV